MKQVSRKALAMLLCLAMLAGYVGMIPVPAATVNAVSTSNTESSKPANPNFLAEYNPTFEEVNDIEGWTVSDKAAVFQSDTVTKDGKLSLKIKDASNKGANYARSAMISIESGVVYYATADVYGTTHGVLTLRFYDSEGKEMTAQKVTKSTATPKTQWQTLTVKITAPEGASKADMELSTTNEGVGDVYFDNVTFYTEPTALYVENSSFEGGYDAQLCVPEGWSDWGGRTPLRQINTNLNYVHKGKQSLKLGVNINPSTGKNATTGVGSSLIDVIVGQRYTYSFWLKSEEFTGGQSLCFVYMKFFNIEGKVIDMKGNVIADNEFSYNKKLSVSSSWQQFTDGATAPTGAVKAQVLFLTSSATRAAVYVDELTLKMDKSMPVMANPSFEDGLNDNGAPTGWEFYGPASDISVVTNNKTDGEYAVKIDNTESKKYSGIRMWLPVREGETWKLSADQKGSVQIYIQYYTADKSTKTSQVKAEGTADETGWKSVKGELKAETTSTGTPGMMQILIYTSSSTPGISYVDNIKLERTGADKFPTFSNLVSNGNFEKRQCVTGWTKMDFDYIQTDEKAGSAQGSFVVRVTDSSKTNVKQMVSDKYPAVPGKYYCATMDCITDTTVQMYVRFYDKDGNRIVSNTFRSINNTDGKWVQAGALSRAPENAVEVEMLFGTSLASVGTVYFDNLYFGEYDIEKDADIEGMTSLKSPGWNDVNFNEVGHPRAFFTEDELVKLRKSVSYGMKNELGYAIRDSYKELLDEADTYLDEKTVRFVWTGVELIYDLETFPDINSLEKIKNPPPGYTGVYPYFSSIGSNLQKRMQVLALAYALSENEEYGKRAIHYATQLCDWINWVQPGTKNENTDMGCSYVTIGAALVYDMCYELLTSEQRVKLYTNIVEKGLKPLSRDSEALVSFNVNLSRVNAIMVASCSIIEESNRELVEPFLTLGYNYSKWYLDELYESGWQEGYDYTDHALDAVIIGIDAIGRATGKEGFMDHPYFEEILMPWIIYGMAPGSGKQPAISDSSSSQHFFVTCMLLNKSTGSEAAGFYLKESGILLSASAFEMLLYSSPEPKIAEREDLYQTTTVVEKIGYGFLRSGWEALDVNLTMVSNQSKHTHNHWDQNSINIAFNSIDMAADFGYASLSGSSTAPGYVFGYYDGHNTIFVDGKPQSVKGTGNMEKVVGNTLYGQITGSAADAYGGTLTQADRHAILINHWDKPYYVIIDELDSNSQHVYNWNLYTRGWNGLQFEDKAVDVGSSAKIHQFAVTKDRDAMFVSIVNKDGLNVRVFNALDNYPVIQIDSPTTSKHQFMTIISMEEEVCKDAVLEFNDLFRGFLYGQTNKPTDKITWSTSYKGGSEVIKKVTVEGYDCVFFRAAAVGDYFEMPFEVETAGTYFVKLSLPMSPNYGDFKVYIDGVPCKNSYNGYGKTVRMTNYEIGLMDVTAGTHTIRFEVVGQDKNASDYLISCGGVILADPNKPAAVSTLNVSETYDDGNVLGATVRYGTVLKDVVLHNRGTGEIAAGGVTTNGKQAAIMGIYESEITQGFSVVKGTSLKFGDTVLMSSTGPVTVAVDYRAVKKQIANTVQYVSSYPEEKDIDRGIPTTYVNTNADAPCSVTINIGKDLPYTATMDGEVLETVYADGFLTFDVPAGNHDVVVVGTHTCVFDQRIEAVAHLKASANCVGPTEFYISCVCGENGTEFFQVGEARGHVWGSGKVTTPATCGYEGTMAYKCKNCSEVRTEAIPAESHAMIPYGGFWACTVCGVRFADAEGTLTLNNLIIIVVAAVAVVLIAGGVVLLVVMKKRKRRKQAFEAAVQSDDASEEEVQVTEEPDQAE